MMGELTDTLPPTDNPIPETTIEERYERLQQEHLELMRHFAEAAQRFDDFRVEMAERNGPPRSQEKRRSMPKIAAPQPFSGKMKEVDAFRTACYMYMRGRADEFPDEESKIIWILSYLQGGIAQKWREVAVREIMAGAIPFENSDELMEAIVKTFGDPNEADTGVFEITTMNQGEKTADEHVQDFKIAAHSAGYSGIALIHEFKRSLNKALRERLNNLERRPTAIEDWYAQAMRLDRQWRQARTEEKIFSGRQYTVPKPPPKPQAANQTQATGPQAPPRRDPNAMDVDRNRKPNSGKCSKCGQTGHFARNCKSRLDVRQMGYDDMKNYWREKLTAEGFSSGSQ